MIVLLIGNPSAGLGQSESRIVRLAGMLESRGHTVEVFFTEKPGDATLRASQIDSRVERLVAVGGDGTVNEILNGLPDPSRVPILQVPTGTANMLARDLALPSGDDRLLRVLEQGTVKWADMGTANGRRFLLLVTCGFDARVTQEVKKGRGKRLGYRGYALPILRSLSGYGSSDLHVSIDGTQEAVGRQVMILNVRHYGGLLVFSEFAAVDSGCFDVCVFEKGSALALIRYGLAGLFRMASKLRDVTVFFGRKITVESSSPCPVEVDGDYLGTTPVSVELVEAKVPLLVPGH